MLSLKSQIGKVVGPYYDLVSQERITAFCRAVGTEEGFFAPPTFLTVFRKGEFELFQLLGIDLSHVLHAEQEYQYDCLIQAGDQIEFETVVLNVLEKQGSTGFMQFLTFETRFKTKRLLQEVVEVRSKQDPQEDKDSPGDSDFEVHSIGRAKTTIVVRERKM